MSLKQSIKSTLKNKIFATCLLAFCASCLFIALAYLNTFLPIQLKFSDYLHSVRKPVEDITIVGIDNKTLSTEDGLGLYENWSRTNFAKVLDSINKYNPRIVAFDFFYKSKKDETGDQNFQTSLENTLKPIIIFFAKVDKNVNGYFIESKEKNTEYPLAIFNNLKNLSVAVAKYIPDLDTVARRIPPFIFNEASNTYNENFSLAIARRFFGDASIPATPDFSPAQYSINKADGGKINIPLEDGQMLINYATDPQQNDNYTSISFVDVFKENYGNQSPQKLFQNKIVLIGPTALYFKDKVPTPMNKTYLMDGVEVHANALQTILEQKFLRNESLGEKIAIIMLLAFGCSFLFMFTRIRWSIAALIGISILYTLAAPFAFSKGLILDLIHPYLTLLAVFMSVYIYRYVTEFREKLALKSAFGKYVNPEVVNQITEHPEKLKLGGEKRPVTVLFTDIAHFTTISESLKPESLVALLNEYFEAMSQVILGEGGTLDKFEGDAIMAFFGAPLAEPSHALKACTVALKMRQKLIQLLQKWQNDPLLPGGEKKPMIDFRSGISSGEVIVGNIGSSERFDYTVMGDTVNLGSRLEGANKKYATHIMISEPVALQVSDYFELRELDIIKVVGKKQPMKVYELLNYKGQLIPKASVLLELYNKGIQLYHERKFAEALEQFKQILADYPNDGPSKLYLQRCEVLKDFPPKADWDGVFEMASK